MKKFVFLAIAIVSFFAATVRACSGNSSIAIFTKDICECENYTCSCCENIKWINAGIDGKLCTYFSYLPHDIGISLIITWNNYTAFNQTVSTTNIPQLCFGLPGVARNNFVVCLKMYEVSLIPGNFRGCAKFSVWLHHKVKKSIDLGCYNISKASLSEAYSMGKRRVQEIMEQNIKSLKFWKNSRSVNDLEAMMISLIDNSNSSNSEANLYNILFSLTCLMFAYCLFQSPTNNFAKIFRARG